MAISHYLIEATGFPQISHLISLQAGEEKLSSPNISYQYFVLSTAFSSLVGKFHIHIYRSLKMCSFGPLVGVKYEMQQREDVLYVLISPPYHE